MKYKYIIIIDSESPVAAQTLDDAIDYVAGKYNITNRWFSFEKEFPHNDIEQNINKFGRYNFFNFDYIITVDKYIEDYMNVVGE